tara:strand:- start:662 stop:1243 length:582 start_codon:yes stop_codon:yes gene_type:complete
MNKSPNEFELSCLAVLLSKGNNPEEKLGDAWALWKSASQFRELKIEEEEDYSSDYEDQRNEYELNQKYRTFNPGEDNDPVRDYLWNKNIRIKKARSVRDNLMRLYKESNDPEMISSLENAYTAKKSLSIPIIHLEELIKFRKQRKREGGLKSRKSFLKKLVQKKRALNFLSTGLATLLHKGSRVSKPLIPCFY